MYFIKAVAVVFVIWALLIGISSASTVKTTIQQPIQQPVGTQYLQGQVLGTNYLNE